MKNYLYTAFLFLLSFGVNAQNLIAVQNGGSPTFYTDLDVAITNAQDGDTLYIPGSSYKSITINKRLHLVGVGHHPDSTSATSRSIIESVSLSIGASNGSLTGLFVTQSITSIDSFIGYTISRCYLLSIISSPNINDNFTIIENIITGTINFNENSAGHLVSNNIIRGGNESRIYGSVIKNNLFLYTNAFNDALFSQNSLIENNFFADSKSRFYICVTNNNVNDGYNGVDGNENQGSGNFLNAGLLETMFINYDPAVHSYQSLYYADFHLPVDSPYKNAGRDGTDIGIYGGAFPWKEGSIPFNPHFQVFQISPKTAANGNLNVNIKVKAQEH
jgi:hypothetical protein